MASRPKTSTPAGAAAAGSGDQYFGSNKKGELAEWKDGLLNPEKTIQKETVKKVVAAMTVGKDVSALFSDMVKCVHTNNIELKKLIYLYIMNYAKTKPELAMMAVNTFNQDAQDPNPLVRALAVRTMGCVRVENIQEYLADPLRRAVKDPDPYVRKTAAISIAKLFEIAPDLVRTQGFVDMLQELISDANPAVVANAVTSLMEVGALELNRKTVQKMLAAMNECSEWGQISVLDALVNYKPLDTRDAQDICERVAPRLNHANPAVVIGAVKTILSMLDHLDEDDDQVKLYCKKMGPPLITMLNGEPEVQYVALRNIDLIIQKRPGVLQSDVKVFFAKYNDPIYVKMEKLEIMVKLASERNIDSVLAEFKEYATEVDVEFVRRAVRSIGRCAIQLERAAPKCVEALLELIKTKVNYVVQEAIVVIKDIFRKYPEKYESVIATLCENLDTLDEPEAKAAMIWIIGEYSPRIENAGELLESFVDGFSDEPANVQLALLTAVVKLFLHRPDDTQELVQRVLQLATEETDNPDLRDRGFIYWRMLSNDPDAARDIVLSSKPQISDSVSRLDPDLLNRLVKDLGTLASVYHKPPETFVPDFRGIAQDREDEDEDDGNEIISTGNDDDSNTPQASAPSGGGGMDDLLGFGTPAPAAAPRQQAAAPSSSTAQKSLWLPADRGKGLEVYGAFLPGGLISLTFKNTSPAPIGQFAIQFNKNSYGIVPAQPLRMPDLAPGASGEATLAMALGQNSGPFNPHLQMAVKCSVGVVYFQAAFDANMLFSNDGPMERPEFLATWQSIDDSLERRMAVNSSMDPATAKKTLTSRSIYTIAEKKVDGKAVLFCAARIKSSGDAVLLEVSVPETADMFGTNSISIAIRTGSGGIQEGLTALLTKILA
eukprot:ANDGO_03804.mRNA.1 Beta-adaptin-like protein C